MKKLISLLLSMTFVVSALSAVPMNSYAEDETVIETIEEETEITTDDIAEILGNEYSEDIVEKLKEKYEDIIELCKEEDPEMYRYISGCGFDYEKVSVSGEYGFGDGKAAAEIEAFMEENDIDEDLVLMTATLLAEEIV